jgi:protein tyrosine phosphatase (PTP) superfamily phosphohydrolase (DUF442 family)
MTPRPHDHDLQDELAALRRDVAEAESGVLRYARLATRAADLLAEWLELAETGEAATDLTARTREFLGRS